MNHMTVLTALVGEAWQQALPKIKAALEAEQLPEDTPWVLAGGYLRDTLMGAPIKDIDVFLPPEAKALKKRVDRTGEEITSWHDYQGWAMESELLGVSKHGDVDLVYLGGDALAGKGFTLEAVVGRFDMGLSCLAVSHTGELFLSEEFMTDYLDHTMTILRFNGSAERCRARVDRLLSKYPDLTVIDKTS